MGFIGRGVMGVMGLMGLMGGTNETYGLALNQAVFDIVIIGVKTFCFLQPGYDANGDG